MKSELRSICIIVPSLVAGGAERVVVSLANEFVRRGYQTALVSLLSGSQLKYLIDRRVELVEINASRFRFGFLQLVMFLKRSRFDVLVANMWPITILVLFAKWLSASTARVT
ncbi:MAG: hypothetical protein EBV34_18680, partial [Betaproteobacteria bacterium]|nr:hypothetical protein [Betaproteobacteria bacterium]